MSQVRRILSLLAVALLLSGLGVGVSAAPALANGCYGYSCHGHDPVVYGCSTSSITSGAAQHNGTTLAYVRNRYSTACNSNWASAWLTSAALNAGDQLSVAIITTDSTGQQEYMCYPGPSNTGAMNEYCNGDYNGPYEAWSDMVDGTKVTTASVLVWDRSGIFLLAAAYADQ